MKYSTFLGVALALGVTPAMLWAEPATAQQATETQPYEANKPTVDIDVNTRDRQRYDRDENDDRLVPEGLVRASELMSHAVYDGQGEQVGEIYDVVLDTNNGKIKYVALSTGGFLGLGDSLHAVPYKAFKSKTNEDGEKVCVLNVNKDRLKNAKGFDQDNWPNMADKTWQQKNDRQYQSVNDNRNR